LNIPFTIGLFRVAKKAKPTAAINTAKRIDELIFDDRCAIKYPKIKYPL
jgi:hypothetical protein